VTIWHRIEIRIWRWLLLLVLWPLLLSSAATAGDLPANRPLSDSDVAQLVQAIKDEVYDYGSYKDFWGFEAQGPNGPRAEFPIFVTPTLTWNTGSWSGKVIYRYPPFGEVMRVFYVNQKGTDAALGGSPESGFPWTQPNILTVYIKDEEICRYKHDWEKIDFTLDLKPTKRRISEAAANQVRRIGSSHRKSR
jgi:hypothetical protein